MDKHDLLPDILEHPDRYTAEQLEEIFSDPEMLETYDSLCRLQSAASADKEPDVDAEWQDFARRHLPQPHRHRFPWLGNRAASIIICTVISIGAMAIGIAVSTSVNRQSKDATAPAEQAVSAEEALPPTVIGAAPLDSVNSTASPILFEDEPLRAIMDSIASTYGVHVRFGNNDVAELHLYYKLDPALTLDEIIRQLDNFEQINITRQGDTITVN